MVFILQWTSDVHLFMQALTSLPWSTSYRNHHGWESQLVTGDTLMTHEPGHQQLPGCYRNNSWSLVTQVKPVRESQRLFQESNIGFIMILNPVCAKFFRGNIKHICTFYVIPPHWYDTGGWNPSSNKTRTYLFYIINIMAAGVLATQGARTSAAMILT